jgi:polyisoprenoid-binding protein YceI
MPAMPNRLRTLAGLAVLLALPSALPAEVARWRIDPVHSRVVFDVDHAGFSASMGVLSGPSGELRFDADTWEGASVEVAMPLATLDFGDADWNATMLGRRWFNANAHPLIAFRSTRIEPVDALQARVHGELTVRGKTVPVVLEVRRNAVKRHPLTLRRTAGFSATTTLDRNDFGLDASPSMIGATVRVRIEVEAQRVRASSPPPSSTPAETTPHAPDQHP